MRLRLRTERFQLVSVLDEELAMTYQERLAYAGTRDFGKIKLVPGGKPITYHVREIPHALWESYVDAAESPADKYRRAFMVGLERVDNLPTDDGALRERWVPNTKNARTDLIVLGEDDLHLFSPAERQEIGSVIYMHSFLPKWTAATYLLPSSLHEPMTALAYRLAELSLAETAASPNAEPLAGTGQRQEATDPSKQPAGAGLDSHTGVSAQVSGS